MSDEHKRLDELRAKMSERQRKQMADLVAKELKRRERAREGGGADSGGGLSSEALGEIYGSVDKNLKSLGRRRKARKSRAEKPRSLLGFKSRANGKDGEASRMFPSTVLILAIVGLGGMKVLFAAGAVDAVAKPEPVAAAFDSESPYTRARLQAPQAASGEVSASKSAPASETERALLLKLDARRAQAGQVLYDPGPLFGVQCLGRYFGAAAIAAAKIARVDQARLDLERVQLPKAVGRKAHAQPDQAGAGH